jgi:hypothetical protein
VQLPAGQTSSKYKGGRHPAARFLHENLELNDRRPSQHALSSYLSALPTCIDSDCFVASRAWRNLDSGPSSKLIERSCLMLMPEADKHWSAHPSPWRWHPQSR